MQFLLLDIRGGFLNITPSNDENFTQMPAQRVFGHLCLLIWQNKGGIRSKDIEI